MRATRKWLYASCRGKGRGAALPAQAEPTGAQRQGWPPILQGACPFSPQAARSPCRRPRAGHQDLPPDKHRLVRRCPSSATPILPGHQRRCRADPPQHSWHCGRRSRAPVLLEHFSAAMPDLDAPPRRTSASSQGPKRTRCGAKGRGSVPLPNHAVQRTAPLSFSAPVRARSVGGTPRRTTLRLEIKHVLDCITSTLLHRSQRVQFMRPDVPIRRVSS
jgi:hypothetical protein